MASHFSPEGSQNLDDHVFQNIPVGPDVASLFNEFFSSNDLAENSRRAIMNDLRKFARWFVGSREDAEARREEERVRWGLGIEVFRYVVWGQRLLLVAARVNRRMG
jgi:hypothetical protein